MFVQSDIIEADGVLTAPADIEAVKVQGIDIQEVDMGEGVTDHSLLERPRNEESHDCCKSFQAMQSSGARVATIPCRHLINAGLQRAALECSWRRRRRN